VRHMIAVGRYARDGHPADRVGGDPVDPRIHLLRKKAIMNIDGLPALSASFDALCPAMTN
jgi:hypothetical protein